MPHMARRNFGGGRDNTGSQGRKSGKHCLAYGGGFEMSEQDITIALLKQRVEALESKVNDIQQDTDSIKSKGYMIAGAIVLMMTVGSIVGWGLSVIDRVRIK